MSLLGLSVVFVVAIDAARTQAHLPLQHGLPPLPSDTIGAAYAGDPPVIYSQPVALGGSRDNAVNAALHDIDAVPMPFNEWDVNHISGPSVFDCPEGFSLTEDNTCIFLEYRFAEESCPYGSYRERSTRGCVQIDSVPPDRTCPAGFDYFMRGCIRRTQIPPMLTCPPGYSQVENLCYSVSSVPPVARCPMGTIMQESGIVTASSSVKVVATCRKETITKPMYQCPVNSRLISQSIIPQSADTRPLDVAPSVGASLGTGKDLWTISTMRPQCLADNGLPPMTSCPAGFVLASGKEIEVAQLEGLDYLIEHAGAPIQMKGRRHVSDLRCIKVAEYEGKLTCPPGYSLVWPPKRDLEQIQVDAYKGARCVSVLSANNKLLRGTGANRSTLEPPATFQDNGITGLAELGDTPSPELPAKTIKIFSERTELFDEAAVLGKASNVRSDERRRGRRREGKSGVSSEVQVSPLRSLLGEAFPGLPLSPPMTGLTHFNHSLNPWASVGVATSDEVYPTIVFDRQSCWAQDLASIKWIEVPDTPVQSPYRAETTASLFSQLKSATDALWRSATSPSVVISVPVCRELQTVDALLSCPPQTTFKCLASMPTSTEDGDASSEDGGDPHDWEESETSSDEEELRSLWQKRGSSITSAPLRSLIMQQTQMDLEHASIRTCLEEISGEAICQPPDQISDAEALCASPTATVQYRPMQAVDIGVTLTSTNDTRRRLSAINSAYKVAVCVESYEVEPDLECPFGVGTVGVNTGKCDVLLAQPLSASCPEGFTKGTQEKSGVFFGDKQKSGKKLGYQAGQVDGGICELVEYADYQITCPAGYTRDRAKNTVAACLAEKLIPPSILCPPGFLPTQGAAESALSLKDPLACVKTVEVAPTVVSYPQESTPPDVGGPIEGAMVTACVLTKEHRLSCGVERKYHGVTDWAKQRAFGDAFKARADKKVRAHTDKYSAQSMSSLI